MREWNLKEAKEYVASVREDLERDIANGCYVSRQSRAMLALDSHYDKMEYMATVMAAERDSASSHALRMLQERNSLQEKNTRCVKALRRLTKWASEYGGDVKELNDLIDIMEVL